MNSAKLKETIANIVKEESEYQVFFRKALEKAGKSITDMSDEEKKAFFNKIDAAWDGKGEKNEELVGNQHKLDVDGDGEIEASDLAALRAKKDESLTEEEIKWNAVENAIINFLKANTKILDKRVKDRDTEGVKGGLKSIISGLTNAQRNLKLESVVNEDTKKRFDVDFYKNSITSGTSHEEIIRGDKFSDVVSQATKVAKSKGMDYVEFYYKDAFIGSIAKKNNYTFKKGRHSDKSPLSVTEGVSPKDMDKIKGAVEAASSFMGIGSELKKTGLRYIFATSPMPVYIVQPTPNNKVAIVNKKYASKPDFVIGDIAVGIMEGKLNEEEIRWNAVENAIINFLKMNTKILDKRVKDRDTDGVKGGLKSIISGLTNAQRNLKLESVNEEIKVGQMVKVVNNPHWEAALGKKGPFKRKVKGIYGDSVFFTDGSNSSMKYIKEDAAVNEYSVNKKFGSKYDIGAGSMGSGTTFWNRKEEEFGDYKKIAHVSDNGVVKFYDKTLPSNVKKHIEDYAKTQKESVNELKKLPNGNFSIKRGYNTFTDYEKNAKPGDTILKYDKRGGMIKTFVSGSELHQNAKKYLSKVHSIVGDKVNLSLFGKQGIATVPDYEKKEVGVLVLESINEGRAFINAARKAKAEGKTEFEFNGKKYPVTLKEGTLNEMNPQLNKAVKTLLDKELKDMRKGGSNHYFAVMNVLMGALTDANFHSESKKVPALFGSKAKYEGDPMGKKDMESLYQSIGERIATMAKWDGEDIAKAVGFYVSMTIGRPMGEKIEKLV